MITPKYDGFFSCACNDFLAAAPVDVTIPEIEELGLTHFVTIGLERSASYFHWWKKGLQSRFVKTINPGFRNRD
jgi:hypothetical protein